MEVIVATDCEKAARRVLAAAEIEKDAKLELVEQFKLQYRLFRANYFASKGDSAGDRKVKYEAAIAAEVNFEMASDDLKVAGNCLISAQAAHTAAANLKQYLNVRLNQRFYEDGDDPAYSHLLYDPVFAPWFKLRKRKLVRSKSL
jgi:hypothetical protein